MALRDRRLPELALFAAAAVLHTWPLASAPATWSRVDNADTALNVWAIAWVGVTLPRDALRVFDANIFYPEPRALAFSEIMLPQAILGAPLTLAGVDPVLVHNLLVLAGFALSGWAMAWVVSRWTGDRAAGVVAGLAYAFNAHTLVRMGHLQALHVQYLPMALFAMDRVLTTPRVRWALLLALGCWLQALTSNYLLVMTAVAMAAAAAVRSETWSAARLSLILLAGLICAVALGPFLYPYWLVHTTQGLVRTFDDVARYSATWREWLSTGGRLHYAWWSHRYFGAASALFPGVVILALSAWAVATGTAWRDGRARMALAVTIAGALLAFGANLPGYHLLYEAVPIFQGIRAVSRFGWLALFGLPILAGIALAGIRTRLSPAPALGLAVLAGLGVTAEALRAPMDFTIYEGIPRIYDRVAAMDHIVLAEVPFPPRQEIRENGPSVLNAAWHLKPLLNGYSGFTPASYDGHAALMQRFPSPGAVRSLAGIGVTHVMVHERRVPPDLLRRCAESPDLALVSDEGDQQLFALVPQDR